MDTQTSRKIVVLEAHDDLYYYWRDNNISGVELVHIDPHCDLHGALIHTGKNYMVHTLSDHVHEGNFLTYAVKEGMVKSIKWVFDEYGNRIYDDTTVKFDTDFSSTSCKLNKPYRLYRLQRTGTIFRSVSIFWGNRI